MTRASPAALLLLLLHLLVGTCSGEPRVYCGTETLYTSSMASSPNPRIATSASAELERVSWTLQLSRSVVPPYLGLLEEDPIGSESEEASRVSLESLLPHPEHGAWLASLLRAESELVWLGPISLEFSPSSYPASPLYPSACEAKKGRRLSLYFANASESRRPFAEFTLPCDAGRRRDSSSPQELRFSVDAHSTQEWGHAPRFVHDDTAFRPTLARGRGETLEHVLARHARAPANSGAAWLPLTARMDFAPQEAPRLRSVSYRACVLLDASRLRAAVAERLRGANPDTLAAAATASLEEGTSPGSASQQGFVMAHSTPVEQDGLLAPLRGCLQTLADGSCVARLGYVNFGDRETYLEPDEEATSANWAEPQALAHALPSRFLPGVHREQFHVSWMCRSAAAPAAAHHWSPMKWTLQGRTVTLSEDTIRCEGDRDFRAPRPSYAKLAHHESAKNTRLVDKEREDLDAGQLYQEIYGARRTLLSLSPPSEEEQQKQQQQQDMQQRPDEQVVTIQTPSPPPARGLVPSLHCAHNFDNGTCVSYWSYSLVSTSAPQDRVVGDRGSSKNYFRPYPQDRDQPTRFWPGRQENVFATYWECPPRDGVSEPATLTWILDGAATARSSAQNTCPTGCDGVPFSRASVDTCGVCEGDGSSCALSPGPFRNSQQQQQQRSLLARALDYFSVGTRSVSTRQIDECVTGEEPACEDPALAKRWCDSDNPKHANLTFDAYPEGPLTGYLEGYNVTISSDGDGLCSPTPYVDSVTGALVLRCHPWTCCAVSLAARTARARRSWITDPFVSLFQSQVQPVEPRSLDGSGSNSTSNSSGTVDVTAADVNFCHNGNVDITVDTNGARSHFMQHGYLDYFGVCNPSGNSTVQYMEICYLNQSMVVDGDTARNLFINSTNSTSLSACAGDNTTSATTIMVTASSTSSTVAASTSSTSARTASSSTSTVAATSSSTTTGAASTSTSSTYATSVTTEIAAAAALTTTNAAATSAAATTTAAAAATTGDTSTCDDYVQCVSTDDGFTKLTGCITFDYDSEVRLEEIGFLQSTPESSRIELYSDEGALIGLFSAQVPVTQANVTGVKSLRVCLDGSEGGITYVQYYYPGSGLENDTCGVCGGDGSSCRQCPSLIEVLYVAEDNFTVDPFAPGEFAFCYESLLAAQPVDEPLQVTGGFSPLVACNLTARGSCDAPLFSDVYLNGSSDGGANQTLDGWTLVVNSTRRTATLCTNRSLSELMQCKQADGSTPAVQVASNSDGTTSITGTFYGYVLHQGDEYNCSSTDDDDALVLREILDAFEVRLDTSGSSVAKFSTDSLDLDAEIVSVQWLPDGNVRLHLLTRVRHVDQNETLLRTTYLCHAEMLLAEMTGFPFEIVPQDSNPCMELADADTFCTQAWDLESVSASALDVDFSGLKPISFTACVFNATRATARLNAHLVLSRFSQVETLHQGLGAALVLYRDANFTQPYFADDPWQPSFLDCETTYALLEIETPQVFLCDGSFDLELSRVLICACDPDSGLEPFDPEHANETGCLTPGLDPAPVVVYSLDDPGSVSPGFDFAFVLAPSPYENCSGLETFSWKNKVFAPQQKLLLQVEWFATSPMDSAGLLARRGVRHSRRGPVTSFVHESEGCDLDVIFVACPEGEEFVMGSCVPDGSSSSGGDCGDECSGGDDDAAAWLLPLLYTLIALLALCLLLTCLVMCFSPENWWSAWLGRGGYVALGGGGGVAAAAAVVGTPLPIVAIGRVDDKEYFEGIRQRGVLGLEL